MRLVFIIILVAVSCQNVKKEKIYFPDEMLGNVQKKLSDCNNFIVYYHSGECSICYGNLLSIKKALPSVHLISISASMDSLLINYYLDEINYKDTSVFDKYDSFYKYNSELLQKFQLFLIDKDFNILNRAVEINDKTLKSFYGALQ